MALMGWGDPTAQGFLAQLSGVGEERGSDTQLPCLRTRQSWTGLGAGCFLLLLPLLWPSPPGPLWEALLSVQEAAA